VSYVTVGESSLDYHVGHQGRLRHFLAMPRITISYRRDDSLDITGRIFDRLAGHFGREAVFRDIDSIPPGADFRRHIDRVLDESDIILAIVGPRWIGPDNEQFRLASPGDPVRLEIETALRKDKPLIPVLVARAVMPHPDVLPDSLHDFVYRNAVQVDSGQDFDVHVGRLIRAIERLLRIDEGRVADEAAPGVIPTNEAAPPIEPTPKAELPVDPLVPPVGRPVVRANGGHTVRRVVGLGLVPQYLSTLGSLLIRPKRFIAEKNPTTDATFVDSLLFLGVSLVLSVLVAVPLRSPDTELWKRLAAISTDTLIVVSLGAIAMRLGWLVVGGKASTRSIFTVTGYFFGVVLVIMSIANVIDLSIIKVLDLELFELIMKRSHQSMQSMLQSPLPPDKIFMFIPMYGIFALLMVWSFVTWGAYREINRVGKFRSFIALVLGFILALPIDALSFFLGEAMRLP
jgi:hypothetical protein